MGLAYLQYIQIKRSLMNPCPAGVQASRAHRRHFQGCTCLVLQERWWAAGWPSGIRVVLNIQLRKLFNYRKGWSQRRTLFRMCPWPRRPRTIWSQGISEGCWEEVLGRGHSMVSNFTKGRYTQGWAAYKLNCGCPLANCFTNCTLMKSWDRD